MNLISEESVNLSEINVTEIKEANVNVNLKHLNNIQYYYINKKLHNIDNDKLSILSIIFVVDYLKY